MSAIRAGVLTIAASLVNSQGKVNLASEDIRLLAGDYLAMHREHAGSTAQRETAETQQTIKPVDRIALRKVALDLAVKTMVVVDVDGVLPLLDTAQLFENYILNGR